MEAFKLPQTIPQDLLLIQDLIAPTPSTEAPSASTTSQQLSVTNAVEVFPPPAKEEDDIGSSGEENDSEDEIAADLIKGASVDDDDLPKVSQIPLSEPSVSASDSDSDSDSDSSEAEDDKIRVPKVMLDIDDDDEPMPSAGTSTYFTTKHEVGEADIPIPDIDEVGSDEVLVKVGDVMNIVDRLAIVRGLPVDSTTGRNTDQALDSDTLLVFDDRKVMGYIYETFGPTAQPFYQVKFNSAFPLDPERVRVGREVFHVPARSRFVFLSQIKAFKGSDASNVHDEEPADDELEFSDDEAEAAHKSQLKRKRSESRARSTAPSRQSTPNPTLMRDQELAEEAVFSRNAYDEHGPYDIDYTAPGPSSRPPPIPYDDPYGDDYTAPDREVASVVPSRNTFDISVGSSYGSGAIGRDGNRGREGREGRGRERDRGRGRGRGRDRVSQHDRGRSRGSGNVPARQRYGQDSVNTYEPSGDSVRSLSPTSLAIARATGQSAGQNPQQPSFPQQGYNQQNSYPQMYAQDMNSTPWNYGQMAGQYPPFSQQHQQYSGAYMQHGGSQQISGYQGRQQQRFDYPAMSGQGVQPFVQPHINPRFASAFGLGLAGMPQMAQSYGSLDMPIPSIGTTPIPPAPVSTIPSVAPAAAWSDEWATSVQRGGSPNLRPSSSTSGPA